MNEDENDDDGDATAKDTKLVEKLTKPREINVVMNSFEPHVVNHFNDGISENWRY